MKTKSFLLNNGSVYTATEKGVFKNGLLVHRPISKKIIKRAVSYSNLSQWIQMEIWKYMEEIKVMDNNVNRGSDLADKIIKKVRQDMLEEIIQALPKSKDITVKLMERGLKTYEKSNT